MAAASGQPGYTPVWTVKPSLTTCQELQGQGQTAPGYRDFLFWEIEPSYNWRIDEPYLDREGAWRIELRLEFLIFDNPQQTLERQIR